MYVEQMLKIHFFIYKLVICNLAWSFLMPKCLRLCFRIILSFINVKV